MNSLEYALTKINKNYDIVLEFGVYEGVSIKIIRNSLDPKFKIYGFDSFEGLPEDWINTVCSKGFFSTNGKIPEINGVIFYKGWFKDSIPLFKKEVVCGSAALIHIDCDLYSSTKTVLESIKDFIQKETILVFDEWIYNGDEKCNDHEQKAFYEWVKENSINYEFIEFNDLTINGHERKIVKII